MAYGNDAGDREHHVVVVQCSQDQEAAVVFHTLAQV